MKIKRLVIYNRLLTAVISGSETQVYDQLCSAAINNDIHGYFCKELLPADNPVSCVNCDVLLVYPMQQLDTSMIALLLDHGAYPPAEICSSGHRYGGGHGKPPTPLKLAVESGSVDDVSKLLSAGADIRLRQLSICVKSRRIRRDFECTHCDTVLMTATRRRDVAMIRFLVTHGANASDVIHMDDDYGRLSKTALAVAAATGDKHVITELVSCGADVNQSLGPRGTVLHYYCDNDELVNLLVRLGADSNARGGAGHSVFFKVLQMGRVHSECRLDLALQSLRLLLPTTRHLHYYLQSCRAILWLHRDCTKLMLQHGARIDYSRAFLAESSRFYMKSMMINRTQHSAEFIELLLAADTDFRGVRKQISLLDSNEWESLNLDVLEDKLSQPLTLQTSCVISVRRRLRSISDVGMWVRIDALPLPTTIKDRLKLIMK